MPAIRIQTRVAAYAVCVRGGSCILLSRWIAGPDRRLWSMPGGGVEHGEDPADAVVREVAEETGYQIKVDRLLGIDSRRWQFQDQDETGEPVDLHGIRIVYLASVTGGALRYETSGSTDMAAWTPRDEVTSLERVSLVDVALRLYDEQPLTGQLA
jgi:8-oxo-dGTP diphosphatase